ncbi:unnamed protein product [Staurois parvus]|uniref:Uncharacterized protein n=1 Tax=Staurois parvus TaxID=386267 RepID=A0ABN9BH21_9NEOB|nr:unnamed protein product [Staurois parvus]
MLLTLVSVGRMLLTLVSVGRMYLTIGGQWKENAPYIGSTVGRLRPYIGDHVGRMFLTLVISGRMSLTLVVSGKNVPYIA